MQRKKIYCMNHLALLIRHRISYININLCMSICMFAIHFHCFNPGPGKLGIMVE